MKFQDFIEKLCDHYPEAVVPFLKNKKECTKDWESYVTQDYDWRLWILTAFLWEESPEGHIYWNTIAQNETGEKNIFDVMEKEGRSSISGSVHWGKETGTITIFEEQNKRRIVTNDPCEDGYKEEELVDGPKEMNFIVILDPDSDFSNLHRNPEMCYEGELYNLEMRMTGSERLGSSNAIMIRGYLL